ncbi:MAG TPA: SUMF1/EgtB/PvdO family nonheme iron enzyme [Phycisphaerae bacterium]|jgi:iron(II)-dependent oxidoreductase
MAINFFTRKSAPATAPPERKAVEVVPGRSGAAKRSQNRAIVALRSARPSKGEAPHEPAERSAYDSDPLRRMLQQRRYAAILDERSRWQAHAEAGRIFAQASEAREQEMALVPAGAVTLSMSLDETNGDQERELEVAPFTIAVHPVTNERFQAFVDAGGYDELDLWPRDIWPHLIEFVDQTNVAAPRYWRQGRHEKRLRDHPVVGVSWYEAAAYARWVGLRLPTEMEWQMSASWRIRSEADLVRRFPWGDAMDRTRCNIWGAGLGGTAPVDAFETGAAPNNVLQLIGNVWEWCDSDFEIVDQENRAVFGEMPMKCVRGGAFDTYFEVQASSSFRSGHVALGRTHNVGFRCGADAP